MDYQQLFQQLKSKLSTFSVYSVVNGILDILLDLDIREEIRPQWHGFTLLQWALLHCSYSSFVSFRRASRNDIISLFNDVSEIEDKYHAIELEKHGIFIQLHAIANQQFQFQIEIDKFTFPRQTILYSKIKIKKSKLDEQFRKMTALTLDEIIVCFTFLYFCIYPVKFKISEPYNGRLSQKYTLTLIKLFGEEKFINFINMITLDTDHINSARAFLQDKSILKNPIFYLFNNSFFTQKPIMKIRKEYRLIHRSLFNVTFRYFLYDMLKSQFKEQFTTEFGQRIEKYVKIGLDELKAQYKDENDLKRDLRDENKVIDYLLENNILIECKGIELHPLPSVSPTKGNLSNYLKGSIIKALSEQVTNILIKYKIPKDDAIVLIITYKELNIGFGKNIIKNIFIDEEIADSIGNLLDSNKVFIIDVEEWDNLLSYVKFNKLTFNEILLRVIEEEMKVRKKSLHMHLSEIYGKIPVELDYLNNEFDEIMSKLINSF